MLGVSNEHEEGHDESLAEETDWAKTYEEMKDKVNNLEKAVHEIEVQLGMKQEEIENKQKELDNANAEIQNKVDELAKLKAGKTDVTPNNDPSISNETAVDPNAAFFNAMVKSIQRRA